MAKDPTQGPVSRYDEMNQPVPVGQQLMDGKDLRTELISRAAGELKQMAAKLGIPRYSKMSKTQLIHAILGFYGFQTVGKPIPSSHHPLMTAEDLAESAPEKMSVRVRRIREALGQ